MQSHNARERDVERRLGRLDSPEPPADLLERIRGDIPEHLRPVARADRPKSGPARPYRLLAASLLLAVAGGLLAYRVLQQAPAPGAGVEAGRPAAAETSGDETTLAAPPVPAPTPATAYPPPARAEETRASERPAERLKQAPDPNRGAEWEAPKAAVEAQREDRLAPAAQTEVGDPEGRPQELERPRAAGYLEGPAVEGPVRAAPAEPEPFARRRPAASPPPTGAGGAATGRSVAAVAPEPRITRRPPIPDPAPGEPGTPTGPSTGGTAEPNDQPWGDMFFRSYGTNPFVDTEDDRLSTFGLDVDTGSYTLARGYLERGHLPPPEAIRVEEFLNFFDYRDPAPRRGEFTLTAEGAPSPWARGPRYQLLRVGVRSGDLPAAERRDATLIFVVDVSGSMARDDRLGLVKRALRLLLDQLGDGDRVGLVVYGDRGRVLLEPSGDLPAVRRAIERLSPGGSTNAEEGLRLGYELARRHFRPRAIHRLVLCSDGVANVGRTGPESILERVGREAEEGIELTTVGFGMGNYNDVMMEQLADRGDGNYAYVDTLAEARRIFVQNLTGTLQTIAADAKIQVEFDPRAVSRYRLLGYENRDVADHRFRDDTVDAGEIGAGHRVTALYEIKLAEDAPRRGALAEVRLRYRSRASGRVVEESLAVRRSDLARGWRDASPSLRLAALAAELAEVLKRSYWARETRPEELRQRARAVERDLPGDADVAELVRLVERATARIDWPEAPGE